MENFADKFVEKMFISGEIGEEEKDRCRYIIVVKIEQILTLFVLLFGACFFRKVIPIVLFLLFFWQIRKRSGGYHMKNFERCFAGTVCIYIIWVKFLAPLLMIHSEIGYGLFAVSVLILEGIGSVNHPNMDWTKEEYAAGNK
ncbi:MAG: accessory gene regulator B family protein [Lachnospiraceae bacterium]